MIVLRCSVGLIGLAFLAGSAPYAGEVADVAGRLPANTSFAVFSRDFAQTCGSFSESQLGRVLDGPAFSSLRQSLAKESVASALELRPLFGFGWGELSDTSDAGAFAVFPLADESTGSAWVFVAKGNTAGTPACLAAAHAYFVNAGYKERRQSYQGATITLYEPVGKHATLAGVLFIGDGVYGAADSLAAAEILLQARPENSLARNKLFARFFESDEVREVRVNGQSPGAAVFFLRPMLFWRHLLASRGSDVGRESFEAAVRLGGEGIVAVAGLVDFGVQPPNDWEITTRIVAPEPLPKALRMIDLQPLPDVTPPAWVRANVISAGFWGWKVPAAIKGFGNLFDEANLPGPDGEGLFDETLDGLRDDPEGVRVDLRKDLFDQLGVRCLCISVGSQDDKKRDSLYAVEARDTKKIINTLQRFYRSDRDVSYAVADNVHTWTVGPGHSLFVEGESESLISIRGVAVGDNRLFFTTEPKLLNLASTRDHAGTTLLENATWKELNSWVQRRQNARTALRAFVRLDRALQDPYGAATLQPSDAEQWTAKILRLLMFGSVASKNRALVESAPGFDAVRGALLQLAVVISREPDGFSLSITGVKTAEETP
jgi:hypothetical protein